MSTGQHVLAAAPNTLQRMLHPRGASGGGNLRGADLRWAIAFVLPYTAVFAAFVIYPYGYALWLAGDPTLYADLIDNRLYLSTLLNTLVFVGVGVNLKMLLALLLSGFFLRPRRWIKLLLAVFVLPWAIASAQACIAFHWMLIPKWGFVDGLLETAFDIVGPDWFGDRWLGIGSNIAAYVWKWLPFWTVIFLAARMTIPRELYDQANIDGATGLRRFAHVTWPLLANLYLICTLLSMLWTVGDFTTVYLVSGGGPAGSQEVLATFGFHLAFDQANPALAVAAVLSATPVLIPIVTLLMRRLMIGGVQL
jgi:multiple sugar transport system permease protein